MTATAPEADQVPANSGESTAHSTPSPQAPNPLKTRINKDNARLLALRGWEMRRAAKANPPPAEPSETATEAKLTVVKDGYLEKRLKTVRAQLDRIDTLMASEEDPQRLDRLASAQARLAEQERLLADRPMPGSKRPAPERAPRSRSLGSIPGPGSSAGAGQE